MSNRKTKYEEAHSQPTPTKALWKLSWLWTDDTNWMECVPKQINNISCRCAHSENRFQTMKGGKTFGHDISLCFHQRGPHTHTDRPMLVRCSCASCEPDKSKKKIDNWAEWVREEARESASHTSSRLHACVFVCRHAITAYLRAYRMRWTASATKCFVVCYTSVWKRAVHIIVCLLRTHTETVWHNSDVVSQSCALYWQTATLGDINVCVLPSGIHACPMTPLYQLLREISEEPNKSDRRAAVREGGWGVERWGGCVWSETRELEPYCDEYRVGTDVFTASAIGVGVNLVRWNHWASFVYLHDSTLNTHANYYLHCIRGI